jgi:hypothetical protein
MPFADHARWMCRTEMLRYVTMLMTIRGAQNHNIVGTFPPISGFIPS